MRITTFVPVGAGIGAVASLAGTVASVAAAAGFLPPLLFEKTWLWKENVSVWGAPLQLFVASWFVAVAWAFRTPATISTAVATWLSASAVLAISIWLAFARTLPLTMLVSGSFAAVIFFLVTCGSYHKRVRTKVGPGDEGSSVGGRMRIAVGLSLFAVTVSLARVGAVVVPETTAGERNVRRWWANHRSADSGSATGLPKNDGPVAVMAFVSYGWQPFRNTLRERIEVIDRFRDAGLDIQFSSHAFPLDVQCNRAMRTMTMVSAAACESAYAISYIRTQHGENEAQAFEQWLLARGTVLDARLIRVYLEQRALLEGFRAGYEHLRKAVERDIALARRLGVAAAPTFVVNGIVVPGTEAALKAILSFELERRRIPSQHSSLQR